MNRRDFIKTLLAGGASALFGRIQAQPLTSILTKSRFLPPVQINTFSSEIVMNSRHSYHSGYSGSLTDQILANVLWAASRAPLIGASRTIYVANSDNVYSYDPALHDIILHLAGNHKSESNAAFEVGVASELPEDAGTALHYAQLASVSFWVNTSSQPSCCPKESARTNANNTWNPAINIQIANCYGLQGTVSGITSQCVAVSSNSSLPDPSTDGTVILENALADLKYGDQFSSNDLTLEQLSQLAWASYGNTPHMTSNNRAGITAASAVANYYLTGMIYIVRPEGVERYHIRLPSGQVTTRDHRIERVTDGDTRPQLRSAIPRIPQTAPAYFVYCTETADRWQRIEAGYCAAGALLQATSMNLQGHFTADFTSGEQTAIINALGIPSSHLPLVVFSGGQEFTGVGEIKTGPAKNVTVAPNPFKDQARIRYAVDSPTRLDLAIYDVSGRRVTTLVNRNQWPGTFTAIWNGTDINGRRLPGGNYYLVLKAGGIEYRQKVTKLM
jgi:hypothetical protein